MIAANASGISSLPKEILSNIFKYGHDPKLATLYTTVESNFAIHVSHVSQHFRQVALSTPLIWSALTNAYLPDQLEAYIERSKNVTLYISINQHVDEAQVSSQSLSDFLNVIVPHAARWEHFAFCNANVTPDEDLEAMEEYPKLVLPSLTTLYLDPFIDPAGAVCLVDFVSQWSVPNLRDFTGVCTLPHQSWRAKLTNWTFSTDTDEGQVLEEDIDILFSTMQDMPELEILTLELNIPAGDVPTQLDALVKFPKLSTLSICLSAPLEGVKWLMLALQALDAPHLESLDIDLNTDNPLRPQKASEVLPVTLTDEAPSIACPRLLDLKVSVYVLDQCEAILSFVLSKFRGRKLEDVRIQGTSAFARPRETLTFSDKLRDFIPPSVRQIQYIRCQGPNVLAS